MLAAFRQSSPEDYAALFEQNRTVSGLPGEIAALPVVEPTEGGFRSECMLFAWDGDFFACDWRGAAADEVFRPHRDEVSVCAAEYLPPRERSAVLDLGTGCGLYGIRARLRTGATVVARDVNARAVAFARRNAAWNGAPDIGFEVADLFDGLGPGFDFVILGLPYQPTPTPARAKVYSYGGDDGSLVLQTALSRLDEVLADGGTAVACCGLLGGATQPALVGDLPRLLPGGDWRVTVAHLPNPVTVRAWWRQKVARPETELERDWIARLEDAGRGWFHYCIVRITLRAREAPGAVVVEDLGARGGMTAESLLGRA
ncbi:MAG TPA: methyltransferase [Thermoleophilaceae bacterium]